jgi:hypothetical protein
VLLEGGTAFTPAADVYAWGVLLWVSLPGCGVCALLRRGAPRSHAV